MTTVIAYWLLPSEPARSFFAETIGKLATRFDAPAFTPHLTLFIAPENSRAPAEVLSNLDAVSVDLPIIELSFSEQFTKTLFVRFRPTNTLQQLNATLQRLTRAPECSLTDPHVSLLYKNLALETKRGLATSIRLPFHDVAFESVCAMRCVSPTETATHVRDWKLA
jgi:Cyclic phosphodiesterase-like protein